MGSLTTMCKGPWPRAKFKVWSYQKPQPLLQSLKRCLESQRNRCERLEMIASRPKTTQVDC